MELELHTTACVIRHAEKGKNFQVDWATEIPWCWLRMVAQLTDESIQTVLKGPDGSTRALVGCSVAARPNSYDHKRHFAMAAAGHSCGQTLPIWDFVLRRDDGSAIRLRPQWSNTKVETFPAEGHDVEVEAPAAGLGNSDGRGTYKRYKTIGAAGLVRFDGRKRPPGRSGVVGQKFDASSTWQ